MAAAAPSCARSRSRAFPTETPGTTRVFAAAQDLDVPLAIHPTFEPPRGAFTIATTSSAGRCGTSISSPARASSTRSRRSSSSASSSASPACACVVLESQAGWIGYFLDRADAIFSGTTLGATVRLEEQPSYYLKRQCYISADPDERTIAALMPLVGEDKFFWASDYPHPDHPGSYLEELRHLTAPMTESGRRAILGKTWRGPTSSADPRIRT